MSERHAWDVDLAQSRIQELRTGPRALLSILHSLQEEFGHIDEAAVPLISCSLNISQAEVHGSISSYH
jgi:formate dehydrogenase subunit gamma